VRYGGLPGNACNAAISTVVRISLVSRFVGGVLGGDSIPFCQSASRVAFNVVVMDFSWNTCFRSWFDRKLY
jgi:hypothetical protein